MAFLSTSEMRSAAEQQNKPLWKIVQETDAAQQEIQAEDSWKKMNEIWKAMCRSIEEYDPNLCSRSGLVGGEGGKMMEYLKAGNTIGGSFLNLVIARALMVGGANACMHRIVAAPTAGSCGVLPSLLYTYWKEHHCAEEEIVQALYVAAGFGEVLAARASIAGADGGCQAEIGSASAMAAAALVSLRGGTPAQMEHACAMALKNLMGLVCDPVCGLVEVPCVKRNVIGATNALAAAEMALAGIESTIPADQVIDTMRSVGDAMSPALKETAQGGLAVTPRAQEIASKLVDCNTK